MIDSFTAIDFETAMRHHICAVGIVTVENGQIVNEFSTLIQPPSNAYSWQTIRVHGITPEDTQNAPNFREVFPELKKRLYGRTLVAHNESFDRTVLIKSMRDNGMAYAELNLADKWECTLRMYRAKGYRPARLNACCEAHDIELNHHDALSDARACAQLFLLGQEGGAL